MALQAALARQLPQEAESFASLRDLCAAKAKSWGWSVSQVKHVWHRREALLAAANKRKVSLRPDLYSGRKGCRRSSRAQRYRGYRLPGAGRKSKLQQELASLRAWFEEQRAYGHSVSKAVLLDRWRLLLQQSSERSKALAGQERD